MLQGARTAEEVRGAITALNGFPQLPIPDDIWDVLGRHLARLAAVGRKVPFADAMIATVAIQHRIELWARDAHYQMFQQIIPELKLFAEPPARS